MVEHLVFPRQAPVLKQAEYAWIKDYIYRKAGIVLGQHKQALVSGRLEKRLRFHKLGSYQEYFCLFGKPGFEQETSMAIDLLTTNETYFFREPKHFEFLRHQVFPSLSVNRSLRIWSAACSSGEEAFTLAMLAAEYSRTGQWEIIGTDLSTKVLEKARGGLYPLSASEKIPQALLKKYCFKGNGEYEGFLLIDPMLRGRVKFHHANLIEKLPELGSFDVIFLRNVMIYFDSQTKLRLVERILRYLRPEGYLIVSHSESLSGTNCGLRMVSPSIYQFRP